MILSRRAVVRNAKVELRSRTRLPGHRGMICLGVFFYENLPVPARAGVGIRRKVWIQG